MHKHTRTHTWPPPPAGGRFGGSSLLQRRFQVCSWATHTWHRTQTGSAVAAAQHSAWPCWSVTGRRSSQTGSSPAPCTDRTRTGSWRRPWNWRLGNEPGSTPRGRSGGGHVVRTVILHSPHPPQDLGHCVGWITEWLLWQGWSGWGVLTVRPVMMMPPAMSNSSDMASWCR